MAAISSCPTCGQPQAIAHMASDAKRCAVCGNELCSSTSDLESRIVVRSFRRPVRRGSWGPVAAGLLVSANLLLGVALMFVTDCFPTLNSPTPGFTSSEMTVARTKSTGAQKTRVASLTDDAGPDRSDSAASMALQQQSLSSPSQPAVDGVSRDESIAESDPLAIANALISAQRPVSGDVAGKNSESSGVSMLEDSQDTIPSAEKQDVASEELSRVERRRLAQIARLKKLIRRHYINQRRSSDRKRGLDSDFFVVAKYEMPLSTRMADVRFEVCAEVDASVDQMADYLLGTPVGVLRDFQVVGRFASMPEAEGGIQTVRQRYDQAKAYQEQLLLFLQSQQRFQARALQRC